MNLDTPQDFSPEWLREIQATMAEDNRKADAMVALELARRLNAELDKYNLKPVTTEEIQGWLDPRAHRPALYRSLSIDGVRHGIEIDISVHLQTLRQEVYGG